MCPGIGARLAEATERQVQTEARALALQSRIAEADRLEEEHSGQLRNATERLAQLEAAVERVIANESRVREDLDRERQARRSCDELIQTLRLDLMRQAGELARSKAEEAASQRLLVEAQSALTQERSARQGTRDLLGSAAGQPSPCPCPSEARRPGLNAP